MNAWRLGQICPVYLNNMLFLVALNAFILAGRAGRYGSNFPVGEVTCMDEEDLLLLHSSLNSPSPILEVT